MSIPEHGKPEVGWAVGHDGSVVGSILDGSVYQVVALVHVIVLARFGSLIENILLLRKRKISKPCFISLILYIAQHRRDLAIFFLVHQTMLFSSLLVSTLVSVATAANQKLKLSSLVILGFLVLITKLKS